MEETYLVLRNRYEQYCNAADELATDIYEAAKNDLTSLNTLIETAICIEDEREKVYREIRAIECGHIVGRMKANTGDIN